MIRWRFNSLLGQLRDIDPKAAEYRSIYDETGIATSTLTAIAKGNKRVDIDVADRLLTFFSAKIGKRFTTQDLLEFTLDDPSDPSDLTSPPKASDAARRTQRSALAPPGAQATPQQLAAEAERRQALLAQAQGFANRAPGVVRPQYEL